MAYNNRETRELEFFDFDFSQRRVHQSEKNPPVCLLCHGIQGQLGAGGPKPIFEDVDQWTRAVQGIHVSTEEIPLARAIERAAEKTFQTNPRYRCLDQETAHRHHFSGRSTSTAPELQEIDTMLSALNERRLARLIQRTSQYDKFKYAIIGSLACFQFENCKLDDPLVKRANGCDGNFTGWLPQSVVNSMTDTSFVDGRVAKARDPLLAVGEIFTRSSRELRSILSRQKEMIESLERGENPLIEVYRGPLSPTNPSSEESIRDRLELAADNLRGPSALDRYKMDVLVRAVRGNLFNPFLRYIFEARGIDIGEFSMDPLPGSYTRSPTGFLIHELVKLESPGSPLSRLRSEMIKASLALPDDPDPSRYLKMTHEQELAVIDESKKVCAKLKTLSWRAFNGGIGRGP